MPDQFMHNITPAQGTVTRPEAERGRTKVKPLRSYSSSNAQAAFYRISGFASHRLWVNSQSVLSSKMSLNYILCDGQRGFSIR